MGRAEREARKLEEQAERDRQALEESPVGRARTAYARGDRLFQCAIDVMDQTRRSMLMGRQVKGEDTDSTAVLNAVAAEGWELVTGSFVFVQQGQSMGPDMSIGKSVATRGTTVGYYLWRRRASGLG